jgi:BirA family biotin operon repressor/biotin-[acetyl-CoA-carboxylase] ligase
MSGIIKLKSVDSTHLYAIRLVEANKITKECVICAENQSNGVGRCNRNWISMPGNLFASMLKKTSPDVDFSKLSMTIAAAIHEAIAEHIPDATELKLHWPNDICYKKKKISGILMAIVNDWSVISFGINVSSAPSVGSSIREISGIRCNVMNVLDAALAAICRWCAYLEEDRFFCVRDYWLRNINEIKCKITVKNGTDSLSGVFLDIDQSGRLVLEEETGRSLFVSSGDLFITQERIVMKNE